MIRIKNPELLRIRRYGVNNHGADQAWYGSSVQRYSGCGPTVCSNILLYYIKSEYFHLNIDSYEPEDNEYIFELMNMVWDYVTPGTMGLNSTKMFKEGLTELTQVKGLSLDIKIMDIPKMRNVRPSYNKVYNFITDLIEKDNPVAFLNLSNGNQNKLESWHWVMITGIDNEKVEIYDQGKKKYINLKQWCETTLLGGGFVGVAT